MLRGTIPWDQAELPVLDETGMAEWHRARGSRVVEHRGRHWVEVALGFCQPVHHLMRLTRDEASWPTWRCLGFRACLQSEHAGAANGALPAHLLSDLGTYSLARLSSRRRQQITQGLRKMDVVLLRSPDLLIDQGYRTASQAVARNPRIRLERPAHFRHKIETFFSPTRGAILAALRGGDLLGFATGYAVDQALYHDVIYVSDAGLSHHVSQCLFHALATLGARTGRLSELMHGLHLREDAGLFEFKRRLGLQIVPIPARVEFARGVETILRRLQPEKHYRWRGRL